MLETATQAHLRSAGSVLSIYREMHPTLSCLRIPLWNWRAPFVRLAESDPFSWKSRLQNPGQVVDGCLGPAWGCGVSSPFSSGTCPSPFTFMSRRYGGERQKKVIGSHIQVMPLLHNPSRAPEAAGEDGVFLCHPRHPASSSPPHASGEEPTA